MATGIITGITTGHGYSSSYQGGGGTGPARPISLATYSPLRTYRPYRPCCGPCSLNGGTVQVYVWPTTTNSNPITITNATAIDTRSMPISLVSNGFYVSFQSLLASVECGLVGSTYGGIILSFAPSRLMTGAQVSNDLALISYPVYKAYADYVWIKMNPHDLTV